VSVPKTADTETDAKATLRLFFRAASNIGFCRNLEYQSKVKPVHCEGDGDWLKLKIVSTAIGKYI
jgi:hypothetical protein